jgi:hypothetical protein
MDCTVDEGLEVDLNRCPAGVDCACKDYLVGKGGGCRAVRESCVREVALGESDDGAE